MRTRGWPEAPAWAGQADRIAPTVVGGSKKHGGPDLGPTRARRAWADLGVDGLGVADDAPGPDYPVGRSPRLTVGIASYDPVNRFPFYRLSYPAGVTKVTATYFGDGNFLSSASQAIMLRINKATTKTRLTIKAAKITYGHEQSERLSATVSLQYAGTPGGKVVIKHGTAVVCTITLASGTGSCALAAKALPVAANHLSATYTGDGNFTGSGAPPVVLTVIR
jgi:hypothetical protein